MVVIEVYRRGLAIIKKVASFWAFLYIWGNDSRSSFQKKTFFWGGGVYIFSCGQSSGAPHEAHICKGHADFFLDWLAQGLLVPYMVLLAQVENLDIIIVNPSLYV